jgi:hypothetical protein
LPLTLEQLAPQVGSRFTTQTQAGAVTLELLEVVERPRRGLPPRFATPLSLLLRGPGSPQLLQDNYELEHPAIGRQLWTLVPVLGPDGAQPGFYEVILSQLNE